jgi:hypothetical protein
MKLTHFSREEDSRDTLDPMPTWQTPRYFTFEFLPGPKPPAASRPSPLSWLGCSVKHVVGLHPEAGRAVSHEGAFLSSGRTMNPTNRPPERDSRRFSSLRFIWQASRF